MIGETNSDDARVDAAARPAAAGIAAAPAEAGTTPDLSIDITEAVCPMTFVRTRLALDRLRPGQVLRVRLRGEEPLRNVPATATAQGHELLDLAREADGAAVLLLRKGGRA